MNTGLSAWLHREPPGAMGGGAWQALITDLVPSSERGKTMGLIAMIVGIVGLPASFIGGYLWEYISPRSLLLMSLIIGIMPAFIFYALVKEPKEREK